MPEYEKKAPLKKPKKPKSYKGHSKAYPQFAFRVPATDKAKKALERVKEEIEALYEHYKTQCPKDRKLPNRNDIILEALEKGVTALKKDAGI